MVSPTDSQVPMALLLEKSSQPIATETSHGRQLQHRSLQVRGFLSQTTSSLSLQLLLEHPSKFMEQHQEELFMHRTNYDHQDHSSSNPQQYSIQRLLLQASLHSMPISSEQVHNSQEPSLEPLFKLRQLLLLLDLSKWKVLQTSTGHSLEIPSLDLIFLTVMVLQTRSSTTQQTRDSNVKQITLSQTQTLPIQKDRVSILSAQSSP